MEEILASIRRIISDDEAKPAGAAPVAAAKPEPAPAPRVEPPRPVAATAKPMMTGIPPSKLVAKPAAAPSPPPASAKNSQDDIDAMLAGFDAPAAAVDTSEIDDAQSEVFELTEQMAMPDTSAGFRKIEPDDDLEFSESTASSPAHATSIAPPSYDRPAPAPPTQAMLSSSTASAVESAFNALATTVLSNNARTLEDLVKEMLRPMLKSWLDDNLPNLVERIVKAEIERVARGR